MKRYGVYLFDFDYTLADSSRGIVMCFRHVLERHGYKCIDDHAIKRTIGKTLEEAFSILTGVEDAATLSLYRSEYVSYADGCMTANTRLFPETARVMAALRERGARTGIISTKYRYRIMEFVDSVLPHGTFDIVIGCEDVRAPKPSPEGLIMAARRLGVPTGDVLYAGDSTVDAETARAAGVDFMGILHGMTTREELAAYPNVLIAEDLTALL